MTDKTLMELCVPKMNFRLRSGNTYVCRMANSDCEYSSHGLPYHNQQPRCLYDSVVQQRKLYEENKDERS